MKPIYKDIVIATFRHLLQIASVWLVAKGIIADETRTLFLDQASADLAALVIGGLAMLVPIVLSFRDKIQKRLERIAAGLTDPKAAIDAVVEARARDLPASEAFK